MCPMYKSFIKMIIVDVVAVIIYSDIVQTLM